MVTTVDKLMGQIHSLTPYAIGIWEDRDGKMQCKWANLTPEEVATKLYNLADMVVEQKIAPKPVKG